jgi:hypothetical protein
MQPLCVFKSGLLRVHFLCVFFFYFVVLFPAIDQPVDHLNQTTPVCPSAAGTLAMKEEPGPAPWGIATAICWPEGAITVSVCLKDVQKNE